VFNHYEIASYTRILKRLGEDDEGGNTSDKSTEALVGAGSASVLSRSRGRGCRGCNNGGGCCGRRWLLAGRGCDRGCGRGLLRCRRGDRRLLRRGRGDRGVDGRGRSRSGVDGCRRGDRGLLRRGRSSSAGLADLGLTVADLGDNVGGVDGAAGASRDECHLASDLDGAGLGNGRGSRVGLRRRGDDRVGLRGGSWWAHWLAACWGRDDGVCLSWGRDDGVCLSRRRDDGVCLHRGSAGLGARSDYVVRGNLGGCRRVL
jgi:hypothetical protein